MKFIPLTKGYVAIVDDDDFDRLSKFKWSVSETADGQTYAVRSIKDKERRAGRLMHKDVLAIADGDAIDHQNRCGIDNRKENLRVCTTTQNAQNRTPRIKWKGKTSKHKGVGYDKYHAGLSKWRARIKVNRKSKHIGWFATEVEAVRAYNEAARQYFGEFACLNEIAG